MTLYQRLAELTGKEEADRLADELREIYGEPPQEVKNLLEIALIKRLASKAGFERVRVDKKGAELDFADKKYLDNPALFAEMERRKNTCRLEAKNCPYKSASTAKTRPQICTVLKISCWL